MSLTASDTESDYKGPGYYGIDDPDLFDIDVERDHYKPATPPPTPALKPAVSAESKPSAPDAPPTAAIASEDMRSDVLNTKSLVHYNLNIWGWPFSLAAIGYYGWVLFDQMKVQLPTIHDDMMPINMAFKLRYIGIMAYFIACLFRRTYIFECRNAEAPLIVSTVLEFYYLLSYTERGEAPPMAYEFLLPLGLNLLCFFRRRPYFKWAMNPWTKDKPNIAAILESLGIETDARTDL